jgi:hypothetical protein
MHNLFGVKSWHKPALGIFLPEMGSIFCPVFRGENVCSNKGSEQYRV